MTDYQRIQAPTQNTGYAWMVVCILTLSYAFAFIDRQVLNLLVEPIKKGFELQDTQISLLQGLAFVSAYVLGGPIAGRMVDVSHRRNIIAVGVALWSVCTALCGLATSYGALFAARVGVGAAEACLMPAAWSLIADYFSREKLPRAMSLYLLGPYLGGGCALILGGMVVGAASKATVEFGPLGVLEPWRLVFVCAGLLGLVPVLLTLLIREPARQALNAAATTAERFTIGEIARFIWHGRAFYVAFFIGVAVLTIVLYAFQAWIPAFFSRRFSVSIRDIGFQYGMLVLLMGCLGVLSGPVIGRWLQRRGHRDFALRAPLIAAICVVPFAAMLPFCRSYAQALVSCAGVTYFCAMPLAMAASGLQLVTPNRMRGIVSAIYMFMISVVGVAIPPTVIALLTDRVFQDPAMVGWSLAIVCVASALIAAAVIARSLGAFRAALVAAETPTTEIA